MWKLDLKLFTALASTEARKLKRTKSMLKEGRGWVELTWDIHVANTETTYIQTMAECNRRRQTCFQTKYLSVSLTVLMKHIFVTVTDVRKK